MAATASGRNSITTFGGGGMPGRGDVPGARLSKNDITNGRLQLQQPIIANYQVHPQMGEWRRQNSENRNIPKERLFTTTLGNGRGDEYALLHVQALDLLFSYKDQGKCGPLDVLRESKTKVFSAWNGAEVPEGMTQEEYEDQFGFRGFSAKPFFFGKQFQPEIGVAGYVAGSKGFWNRGWSEFFPGDKVMWQLPSIDPKLREEQRELLPHDNEHPKMRDAAIVNRLTYEDAHQFIHKELTKSMNDALAKQYLWTICRPQSNSRVTDTHAAVIYIRNLVPWCGLAMAAVLQAYGVITINTPQEKSGVVDPLDSRMYNLNRPFEDQPLKAVIRTKVEQDPNTGMTRQLGKLSDVEFEQRANKLVFLGAKMGLLPLVNQAIQPSYNMINAVCGVALKGLLMDPKLHTAFSIERFFPAKMRNTSTIIPNSRVDMARQYRLDTAVGSFRYIQDSFWQRGMQLFAHAAARVDSHVACIAISNGRPGEWVDEYH